MPTFITYTCSTCKRKYPRRLGYISKKFKYQKRYCSSKCQHKGIRKNPKKIYCLQCDKIVIIKDGHIKKFCNSSCAARYNNKYKTKGIRISKLELFIQKELLKLYPKLNIKFNYKTIINSELDIYIPSLHLAFEVNGIFHYKPIYGVKKFNQIKKNDKIKRNKCKEQNIKLVIINSSKQKTFTEKSSKIYLKKIVSFIRKYS